MAQTLAAGHPIRALPHGHACARRDPEKTALYQVFLRHLPGFERMWADSDSGNCLPGHVTEELQKFLTLPYPLRYPLAFDARHLGHVLRLFTDMVGAWYRRHHPGSKSGSVTVIQRATSDLRLNPHFHTLFLDGVYVPPQQPEVADAESSAPLFHAAPKPTQADIEFGYSRRCSCRPMRRVHRSGRNRGLAGVSGLIGSIPVGEG